MLFGFIGNLGGSAIDEIGPSDPDISVSETDPTDSLEKQAVLETASPFKLKKQVLKKVFFRE